MMAQALILSFEKHWQNELESFEEDTRDTVRENPDVSEVIKQVCKFLSDIASLAVKPGRKIGQSVPLQSPEGQESF